MFIKNHISVYICATLFLSWMPFNWDVLLTEMCYCSQLYGIWQHEFQIEDCFCLVVTWTKFVATVRGSMERKLRKLRSNTIFVTTFKIIFALIVTVTISMIFSTLLKTATLRCVLLTFLTPITCYFCKFFELK